MVRFILVLATSVALFVPAHVDPAAVVAQCSYAPGSVVQLVGTPHLFIVDDQGVLHWGGDTRALAGRTIDWSDECELGLATLQQTRRGDPWLSSGLPQVGEPIYLSKWEDTDPSPTLLHIQSIADLELFGINAANYGNFVLQRATYEQRYGFPVGTLRVGPLASTAAFAWSTQQQADYASLLAQMTTAESAALLSATNAGVDPGASLPPIANCERQGLAEFERSFNAGAAQQTTQSCLTQLAFGPTPVVPSPGVPPAPANLRALAVGPAQIQVTWNVAPNQDGFRVRGGPQALMPVQLAVIPGNTSSYTDANLSPGTTYCYTVTAFNRAGDSPASGPVCAVTLGGGAPLAPTNLRVTPLDPTLNQLQWTIASANQDGFRVLRVMPGTAPDVIATLPANATSYTDRALRPGVENCYQVQAYNAAGEASSPPVCAGTPPPDGGLVPPTNVRATPLIGGPTVRLEWSYVSPNADGFRIRRTPPNTIVATLPPNTTSYNDVVGQGGEVCYQVIAFRGPAEAPSSTVCVDVPAPPPLPR